MPASLVQTFRAFAYNNAWANHRMLTACAGLSQAEFAAARTGFFPSLQATLNHIHVIDLFYVDALEGGWLGPEAWANEVPYPAVDALTPARLDDVVRVNRDTSVQTERRDRLLMHLFQHQIHHRGQAHAMLAETTVKPPQLDEFFAAGEAPLREAEFRELGWSEAAVWGG